MSKAFKLKTKDPKPSKTSDKREKTVGTATGPATHPGLPKSTRKVTQTGRMPKPVRMTSNGRMRAKGRKPPKRSPSEPVFI